MSKASQRQSHSIAETASSTAIGYIINVTAQHFIFPLLGIHISTATNLTIGAIFTIISVARGYILRRVFNYVHVHWDEIKSYVESIRSKTA